MREIKFRGKLINSGKWAYGNLNIKINGVCIITPDETVIGTYGKVIPETVGQYTGLKDKNGKEIYEGDIVIVKDIDGTKYKGYIIFLNGSFSVDFGFEDFKPVMCTYRQYEVIGNIYDNPELLKEAENE